ncbi:MAG: hypothetical protein CFE47_04255 [Pseudomonas sp. PGPPP1]|uniref:hypothetical protein n=1 Tax=Pseudomonas sp. PGPPP1 TaxID=2015553 RepID=UPI000BCD0D80|nr:hypothetical protein [Pseudomonas sp. PGPPP1]OYU09572.1 MAG: hypothetical protein CFE47_04255 [Pseudomonas sp. PGPPP1]
MIISSPTSTGKISKQDPGYIIKEPKKVITDFTVKDDSQAAKVLTLKDDVQISDLKKFLKKYDMTHITNMELKQVGRKLYENKLISEQAFGVFIDGTNAVDKDGHQADLHVKFNAIALFDQRLEEQTSWMSSYTEQQKQEPLFWPWRQGMIDANKAVNALAYFAWSSRKDFAVDEQA